MVYKVSQYTSEQKVFIKDSNEKKTLLYSTRSSAFLAVDSNMWADIKKGLTSNVKDNDLNSLVDNQLIVDADEDELSLIVKSTQEDIKNNSKKTLYMAIQSSANCPLGCHYCGQEHTNKHMSREKRDEFVAYVEQKIKDSPQFKKLHFNWFGGEPLSAYAVIEDLAPQLIQLGEKYKMPCSFSMTSNGLLLDKQKAKDLVEKYALVQIEITLDGIAPYHDKRRHLKTGGPTFNKIYQNIKSFLEIKPDNVRLSIRCNVDERNKEGITPLIVKIANDNLHKKIAYLYAAPIHSWGNDAHKLAAQKEQFAQWEIEWMIEMKELGYSVVFLPGRKRRSFCMAVTPGWEIVDPYGDLYNCVEISLVPKYEDENRKNTYAIGNVKDKKLSHPERKKWVGEGFNEKDTLQKYPCYNCSILPICGGACPKEWLEGHQPCPPVKYNIKERMLLQYAQHLQSDKESSQAAAS